MTHFRKLGSAAKGTNDSEKPAKVTKTSKAATPRAASKGKKAKAETAAERTPTPDGDLPSPPATGRAKRAGTKRNYAQLAGEDDSSGDDDGMDDRVKIEVGEDIGEGLRQGPPGPNEEEEI
jgi:hypothetical protein